MKSTSLIKYSGSLVGDIITLTDMISITDNIIKCEWDTMHESFPRFKINDIITIKINNNFFSCNIINWNELGIITRKNPQTQNIGSSNTLFVLLHLTSDDAESLVTKYELNRLKTDLDKSYNELLFIISNENIMSQSYDLSLFLEQSISNYIININFYDVINNTNSIQYEDSYLDWDINTNNNTFTWKSLTPLTDTTLVVVIQYKLKTYYDTIN